MAESRGMDVIRSNDGSILFRALLLDASRNPITTAGSLRIFHFTPTTGDIETYDFNDDTFKTGAVTTATTNTTHETGENGSFDTGVHQVRHATLTDFTIGDKYFGYFTHASLPAPIVVEFQYGDLEGDLAFHLVLRERETAQGGAATTITLNTNASSTNDFYNGQLIMIVAGTGAGQARVIRSYAGGTRIATVRTWITNPDNTSEYVLLPLDDESTIDGVWDENVVAAHATAQSAGLLLNTLGGAIAARSFNTTLNALLGVPDTAVTDTVTGQVWEELAASHNNANTMGEIMNNISGGGFPTLAQIADAVWDEVITSGHAVAGSAAVILAALNLTGRSNTPTLDGLLGVPDVASATIAESIWDEVITSGHAVGGSAAVALDAIGSAIAARSNNPTLNALLGVADTAGHTIADPILDEVVDGASHTTANSVGQRLTAIDTLTEAGGTGDLADVRTQVRKIDQTAASGTPAADSVVDKLDTITATLSVLDRDILLSVNIQGSVLHVEAAVEQFGVIQTSPWVDCAAQIYDEANALIHNVGIGDFGAIGPRGFFTFDIASHSIVAGNTYQIAVEITNGAVLSVSTTKPFKVITG